MHTIRLPYHDRYPYSPITERKDYSWPGGKRLAVYLGLNIEHFAFGAGEVKGSEQQRQGDQSTHENLRVNLTSRERFGGRQG